jgi:hypothetical protein
MRGKPSYSNIQMTRQASAWWTIEAQSTVSKNPRQRSLSLGQIGATSGAQKGPRASPAALPGRHPGTAGFVRQLSKPAVNPLPLWVPTGLSGKNCLHALPEPEGTARTTPSSTSCRGALRCGERPQRERLLVRSGWPRPWLGLRKRPSRRWPALSVPAYRATRPAGPPPRSIPGSESA